MAINNIVALAEARTRGRRVDDRGTAPPSDEGDGRPLVYVRSGALREVINEAEEALIGLDDGLYRQGERLVRVIWDRIKVSGGGDGNALRISEMSAPHLVEAMTAAARFMKWDGRKDDWVLTNCPSGIAEAYLARKGAWKLPFLLGVTTTPILRPDGTVLDKAGYDEGTGILFDPFGVEFPPIPERPSKDDALRALAILSEPIAEFPFASESSRSVALSGMVTAVVRRSLPTAPMHAYSAPTAGSGKSLLVDIASVIATGERASVTSTGNARDSEVELEKRLSASMLAGDAVLSIDNISVPLNSDLLCQLLTQTTVKIRVLGKSENVSVPITTTFYATGNNLTVAGDLTRRVLKADLSVDDERPELRTFAFDPVQMVRERRPEFVVAALTIVRAYQLSEEQVSVTPLGSFSEWSRRVREALMWLGLADPVEVIEDVRRNDPYLQRLQIMLDAWDNAFGDTEQRVRDVVRAATETDRETGNLLRPELREALGGVAGDGQHMNPERISWWLRKNAGRVVSGRHFEACGSPSKPAWKLVGGGAADVAAPPQQAAVSFDLDYDIPLGEG